MVAKLGDIRCALPKDARQNAEQDQRQQSRGDGGRPIVSRASRETALLLMGEIGHKAAPVPGSL